MTMVPPYLVSEIWYPALVILVVGFVASLLATRWILASVVAAGIKSGLFLLNFSVFFTGQVTGFDDLYYLVIAERFRAAGVGVMDVVTRRQELVDLSESAHILYPLHNYYSTMLFGPYYFAPVAVNILVTFAIGVIAMRLAASEFRLSTRQARAFYFCIVLYPELLAWSTTFNGKEVLVLLSHVCVLLGISRLFRGQLLRAVAILVPATFGLVLLRYYIPLFLVTAFVFHSLFERQKKHRLKTILLCLAGGLAVFVQLFGGIEYGFRFFADTFSNPAFGLVHFLYTPIPFNTQAEYTFLNLPSVYHWLAFPLFVVGLRAVYRMKTRFSGYLIWYFCTIVAFYSLFEGLQGARHRFQLTFAFVVFEFLGAMILLRALGRRRSPATRAPSQRPLQPSYDAGMSPVMQARESSFG